MKERPILFSGPMVLAILAGKKTQMRRVVAHRQFGPSETRGYDWTWRDKRGLWQDVSTERLLDRYCPFGKPGDRLWVRETHCIEPGTTAENWDREAGDEVMYRADGDVTWAGEGGACWRPSIFMPRWASRITLEVTSARVERLNYISEDDAKAEGVPRHPTEDGWCLPETEHAVATTAKRAFLSLWESINGERPGCTWLDNPWVWVVSFKRI